MLAYNVFWSNLPPIPSHSVPPQRLPCPFFPPTLQELLKFNSSCYMYVYGCWTFFCVTGSNLGAILLNQTDSSLSRSYKLAICPKLERNYMSPSFLHAGIVMWLTYLRDLIHTVPIAVSSCAQWHCRVWEILPCWRCPLHLTLTICLPPFPIRSF